MIPPLAIIQARLHSTRLPNKMLLDLGGHPVIWWAWRAGCETFGRGHVVIACPAADWDSFNTAVPPALIYGYLGDEADVLGRFRACAHFYRSVPESVIVRITPDDFPIDVHRERCTLAQLDDWHATVTEAVYREHIGSLFASRLEINTQADLDAVRRRVEQHER